MQKIDLGRELGSLMKPPTDQAVEVDVPPMWFLCVDGSGAPDGDDFQHAVGALYAMSYAVKFAAKRLLGIDHRVMPLEALWGSSAADMNRPRETWRWRAMTSQPGTVTSEIVKGAREAVASKVDAALLDRVLFEPFIEGHCVQIMHVGPYSAELPTIEKMHAFIAERGLRAYGRHHEIYLGDPRRSAPGKLKTILRQPVR